MKHLSLNWNSNHAKYLLFSLFLSIGLNSAFGQQLDFEKYYFDNPNLNLNVYDVIRTSDHGFLMTGEIVGFNTTYFLMKLNAFGDTLWFKSPPPGGGWLSGQTLIELTNGNYALLCTEYLSYQSLLLVIYDSTGNILSTNHYRDSTDLYITNISESNSNLFLLGQRHTGGTESYLLKTNLIGDSLSCYIDSSFLIANHNNSVCFNGREFLTIGTSKDSSGVLFPEVEKFDTNGIVLSKFDYPQFAVSTGSQLFQYSNGYILKTISMTIGDHLIRIDSLGSIVWDTQISQTTNSITSPDNNRILVASDGINLYWYDSSGAFINYQSIPLILPGLKTMVKTINNDQQISFAGVVESGSFPTNFSAFLVQLTDTSVVSSNDLLINYNSYLYPTMCTSGEQIYFHVFDKIPKDTKYAIYNSLGKLISEDGISVSNPSSEAVIKIPDSITCGIYFLKIFSNDLHNTFRLIVQ